MSNDRVQGALDWSICKLIVIAICLAALLIAATSPLNPFMSTSLAWELAALVVTFVICLHFYLDVYFFGDKKIRHAVDSGRSTLFILSFLGLILCLFIAFLFAGLPEWLGWDNNHSCWWGQWWYSVHAFFLFLGAICAVSYSFVLSSDNAIREALRNGNGNANTEERADLATLRDEIRASRRALWLADIPTCIAFFMIALTVWIAWCNTPAMKNEELKAFIGGGVAMSLVANNVIHVSLRLGKWQHD